jgi:hypothetical protein
MKCRNCGEEIRLWLEGGKLWVNPNVDKFHDTTCGSFPGMENIPIDLRVFDAPHVPESETDEVLRLLKEYDEV